MYLFLIGRLREAEEIDIEVLELRREVLSEKHSDTLKSMVNLVIIYY
jgi:Tetratricopeptide repeat